MAATTASEANALIADATCDLSCLPPGLVWYAILAALIDVGNGQPVPDATTLASEANCLLCVLSPGMVPYAILQAIRNLTSGGSGLSGVTCLTGADPVAAPTGTCGIAYRTDNGALWKWNGASWDQLLGP